MRGFHAAPSHDAGSRRTSRECPPRCRSVVDRSYFLGLWKASTTPVAQLLIKMTKLTESLLNESGRKYDELVSLVDSDEKAATLLDDTVYTIAGILNGGLEKIAESSTYYNHFTASIRFLERSVFNSMVAGDGPIDQWFKLLSRARGSVREYKEALSGRRYDDEREEAHEEFLPVADEVEDWIYNDANLEALSSSLIDLVMKY